MENISQVSLGLVVLLSFESSRHIGISEEVFVKPFISIFLLLDFVVTANYFWQDSVSPSEKKKSSMLQENQVSKKIRS